MESKSLEQVIRQYVQLPPNPSGSGWYSVLHTTCDKGHKGPRGGWKFDNKTVAFHCFNCSLSTVYDPNTHKTMPEKMVKALADFNVPEDEWQQVVFTSMVRQQDSTSLQIAKKPSEIIEPQEISVPDCFYFMKDAKQNDKWAEIARHYLTEERGIDPSSYPFMLSSRSNDPLLGKWIGRVIIPMYKQNRLIYYTGRDLTEQKKKKYENASVSRERVLYGFDQLFKHTELPLYVTEGWFDAHVIDGVAILGNEISKAQIEWLTRSPRKKIYIPDRQGDGSLAAEQALKQGWSIAIPDTRSCKDMNAAVNQYGKLYVMKSLVDNTFSGFEAAIQMGIHIQ